MFLKRGQLPILIVNSLLIVIFLFLFWERKNYEFVIYIGVIVLIFGLILLTNKKNNLSNFVLWGLSGWAVFHLCGGYFNINGLRLYEIMIFNFIQTEKIYFLRYDQFVHMYGFAVATFAAYDVLYPYLKEKINYKVVSVLLVLIGMGAGAFNEVVEFIAVLAVPETGVGGFYNTSWDLVFNTIGAIIAVLIINLKRKNSKKIKLD